MRIGCVSLVLLLFGLRSFAQEIKKDSSVSAKKDTTTLRDDSTMIGNRKVITIESYAKRFDPRKALFYSAILPGAGQAYNKKYWKIPFVYGGLLGLIAVVKFYNDAEVRNKDHLFYCLNNPGALAYGPGFTTTNADLIPQLRTIVDQARRQRDYFMIITGFFYILQMVDAHVDAHLKEFDLNPKLQVRLDPFFSPMQGLGMGIKVRF